MRIKLQQVFWKLDRAAVCGSRDARPARPSQHGGRAAERARRERSVPGLGGARQIQREPAVALPIHVQVAARVPLVPTKAGTHSSFAMLSGFPAFAGTSGEELFLRRFDDRVVARGVEAEQIPRLLHVRRQRRRDVDRAAARMRHHDAARQQMQPVLHAAGQLPVLDRGNISDRRRSDGRYAPCARAADACGRSPA